MVSESAIMSGIDESDPVRNSVAVLFDLDGTLLDTAADFVGVLHTQCMRHGIKPPEEQRIRNTVSDGARALVTLAFNRAETHPEAEDLRQELLDIYEQQLGLHTELFGGMQGVLNQIGELGIPWGVVTNKPRRFAQPLMEHMKLSPKMAVLVCPDDVVNTKPDPEPMFKAAEAMGVAANNCIYVGDHHRDIDAGKNAGMTTVAAAYGYVENHAAAEAWLADHLISAAGELTPIISRFHSSRRLVG